MATGWNNGLNQDYNKALGAWFANRLGARQQLREEFMKKYIITESQREFIDMHMPGYLYALKPIEPLTDEQIDALWIRANRQIGTTMNNFARSIEHHITGETHEL